MGYWRWQKKQTALGEYVYEGMMWDESYEGEVVVVACVWSQQGVEQTTEGKTLLTAGHTFPHLLPSVLLSSKTRQL
jgi:hypothetical protein